MRMTYYFGSFWRFPGIWYISIFSYFCSRNNEDILYNENSRKYGKNDFDADFTVGFYSVECKELHRLIRNATLKMEYAGKQILVDPMLGAKGSLGLALGVNINPRVNLTIPVEDVLDGLDFNLGLMKNLEVIS